MTDAVADAPAGLRPGRALAVVAAAALVGVGGGAAVRLSRPAAHPAPRLPVLHGQATWAKGLRPAPAFSLRAGRRTVSLRSLRGRTVLLAFLRRGCSRCAATTGAIVQTLAALPAEARPTVVAVGGGGPAGSLRLTGPAAALARLRDAYAAGAWGRAIFLIDRSGDERSAYVAPFLPGFVAHDLSALAAGA